MAFNNVNTNQIMDYIEETNASVEEENAKRFKIGNEDNMTSKTQTMMITPDQRASKLKRLEQENEILRERLANMEKLIALNTKANEAQAIRNNKFGALINEEIETDQNEDNSPFETTKKAIKRKNTYPVRITNQNEAKNKNTETNVMMGRKMNKPPPLHIHNQNIKDTLQLVKGAQIENFEIKRINQEKHSLITKNMDEYKKMNEIFKEVNTNFFTYTPKDQKPKTIVLKGLNEDEDVEDIKTCIEKQTNIKIIKVTQLTTKRSTESKYKLPLYIIQCAADSDMVQLYKMKTLNHQIISWENLKKRNEILQCFKCQRFGHAAANCNLNYRCVKCALQHKPGECLLKEKTSNNNIYCVNCKENGHPASFKGCPIYQSALLRLKQKLKDNQRLPKPVKIALATPVNKENGTFAEILKKNKSEQITVQSLASKVEKMSQIIQQQSEQIASLLNLLNSL